MVSLPKSRVLDIGVSNFSPLQLRNLIGETRVKPAVHQMELHPYLQQEAWIAANRALGISITAYSPLGNSNPTYHSFLSSPVSFFSSLLNLKGQSPPPLLENEVLKDIAQQRNCTPAQVALKWGMGRGTSVIPKSSHEEWIRENYESQRCLLRLEDLVRLKGVGSKWMTRFNNPSKNWGVKLFDGLDGA
jgi:alcohol dehydrogenase (NADP+)